MATVSEITTLPADMKTILDISEEKEKIRDPESSESASIAAGDVHDANGQPPWRRDRIIRG